MDHSTLSKNEQIPLSSGGLLSALNEAFLLLFNEDLKGFLQQSCELLEAKSVFLNKHISLQEEELSLQTYAAYHQKNATQYENNDKEFNVSLRDEEVDFFQRLKNNCSTKKENKLTRLIIDDTSFLLIPIYKKAQLWGYLMAEKVLSFKEDVQDSFDIFHSLALNIGAYLERQQTSTALNHYQKMLDHCPSLMCVKDLDGRYKMANKVVASAYGKSLDTIIGKTDLELHPDDGEGKWLLEHHLNTVASKNFNITQRPVKYPDGSVHLLQFIRKPIFDDSGQVTEVIGITTDITSQKTMEDEVQKGQELNTLLMSMVPDQIFLVDYNEKRIIHSNSDGSFLGYEVSEHGVTYEFFLSIIHPDDQDKAITNFYDTLEQLDVGEFIELEYRIKDAKGNWHWFYERATVMRRNPDGSLNAYMNILHNITERKTAEERLRISQERYKNFITYSNDGIYFMNCGTPIPVELPLKEQVDRYYETAYIEECNLALAKMYGFDSTAKVVGVRIYDMHKGENYEENKKSFISFVENGYRVSEVVTVEPDTFGEMHYFVNNAVGVIRDGFLVGIWGTQQDISYKKKAELALRESEERLELAVNGAKLGIWDWNISSGKVSYNKYWASMLGYEEEEINDDFTFFMQHIHPEDVGRVNGAIQKHIAEQTDFFEEEFRLKSYGDNWKWIYDRGRVIAWDEFGVPIRAVGMHMDVTERKNAELALREREAVFRTLYEESPIGVLFIDQNGEIIQANNYCCRLFAYSESELKGQPFITLSKEKDKVLDGNMKMLAEKGGSANLNFEACYLRKDGQEVWASVSMTSIWSTDNKFEYIIAMIEDITDKKMALEALKGSEAMQKAILSALPDLKFRINWDGVILSYYSSELEKYELYDQPQNFLGKPVREILPAYVANAIMHNVENALKEKNVKTVEYFLNIREEMRFYEARISYIDEEGAIVVVRNISALKRAQTELQDKIKELDIKNKQLKTYIDSNLQLENFAYIASHDLREPVRTMRSFAQLLAHRYGEQLDSAGQSYVKFIMDSANHMNQLIQDLLAYSRVNSEKSSVETVDIEEMIIQVTNDLHELILEKEADIRIITPLPAIQANSMKINQVFQNLITNALKFSNDGTPPFIQISGEDIGNHYKFMVKDNGIGIDPEFHDKIFLLFKKLHNKEAFQGTGLGLAICKKVVEQHGGNIWVESSLGEGATFYFTIQK